MNPHFLSTASGPIFGIHTPAQGLAETGVVICPPMGQEALRAHRSLRILADQLAAAGVEVLRFDYFGTGDSAGELRDGRVPVWAENVRAASQHLRELTPVQRVMLVGLRLGATLALLAEAPAISRAILWDPILDGSAYLDELRRAASDPSGKDWEVQGFPIVPPLRDDITSLDLAGVRRLPPDVRIIVTEDSSRLSDASAALEARRVRVTTARVDAPHVWAEDEPFGVGAVPAQVLRQIVAWTA